MTDESWLLTTIETQSELYRCGDVYYIEKLSSRDCCILGSD
jgi:hypothetical protein